MNTENIKSEILKAADDSFVGLADALKTYIALKAIEKTLLTALESVKEGALSEAKKYGQKSFVAFGANVEIGELGTKYVFDACGDVQWEQWEQSVKSASNFKKERETFLKTLKEPMTVVDEQTGETNTIYPASKISTTGLKIKL